MTETVSNLIKNKAKEIGFSACGIAPIYSLESERQPLKSWIEKGMHGTMGYLERNIEKRLNPAELLEGARSVITVLLNYYSPLKQVDPEAPVISKYAYGKDYHIVLKERLNQLLRFIEKKIAPCKGRGFVDSAPVLEKAWASESGLGWIGKHSLLISKEYGSFVFIGELIIDLELDYSIEKETDYCGACTRCIDACPTKAIVSPRVIDARKCIAYHTIENKGEFPTEVVENLNNRAFGCDICQDACPWNKEKTETEIQEFHPISSLLEMNRKAWHNLDQKMFDRMFRQTALGRAGYSKLMQNISYTSQKE